jgi:predicted transposase YbfD/YdcC
MEQGMKKTQVTLTIIKNFASLEDPRILLKTAHKLIDIIVIAICAVICGADKWTQVEEFGNAHKKWLKRYLELPNGIPTHDTFGRVFAAINPEHFQRCFAGWIQEVFTLTEGQVIAIDGKTLRRSHDKRSNKAALHMVHAWATANGVLLGQVKSKEKSNEITAIPDLLETLVIKGCIITIDAMGCQRKIAEKIHDCQADYVLAVKENQGKLKEAIEKTFTIAKEKNFVSMVYDYHQTVDGDHGRIETRSYYVLPLMYLFNFRLKWKGLQSLILVENERINKATNERAVERRYYISSLKYDAKK